MIEPDKQPPVDAAVARSIKKPDAFMKPGSFGKTPGKAKANTSTRIRPMNFKPTRGRKRKPDPRNVKFFIFLILFSIVAAYGAEDNILTNSTDNIMIGEVPVFESEHNWIRDCQSCSLTNCKNVFLCECSNVAVIDIKGAIIMNATNCVIQPKSK